MVLWWILVGLWFGGGVMVAIMVVMDGNVADCGGCIGYWWWF